MEKTNDIASKIAKLEDKGWRYEHELRIHIKDNVFVQIMAMVKDNEYRAIKNGKIGRVKAI